MLLAGLAPFLEPYRKKIDRQISFCRDRFGSPSPLQEACLSALQNGGKRFRPALVWIIADSLGKQADVAEAALAVEFFHTASLIADDLPCMDNDDERRNMPATHKVYGESVALLATYALISAGYHSLARNAQELSRTTHSFAHKSHEICTLALENATHNTGVYGATGGQFLDLFSKDFNLEICKDLIQKKTSSLFELSFVLGWLYGGGEIAYLENVKKAAAHFGMAFQLADDLEDIQQDEMAGKKVNLASLLGLEQTHLLFQEEINHFLKLIKTLGIDESPLKKFAEIVKTCLRR